MDLTENCPPAPKRRRSVQQRTIDTRGKIIDAAAREFALHGFEGASTRVIAQNAGVQHTLVTYHFQSKEGLWRETLDKLTEQQKAALEKRLSGLRGVDSSTALYLYLKDFIRFSAERPEYDWIMSHVASQPSSQLEWLYEHRLRAGFERMEGLIAEAQRAGKFIPGNPRYLYYLLIGMVTRIFMLSAEVEKMLDMSPFDPAFVDHHASMCLKFFFRNIPEVEAELPTTLPRPKRARRKPSSKPKDPATSS
jgi:AcrR family transcriptional regulator